MRSWIPTHEGRKMHHFKWSDSEKKIARRVFESALQQELAEILSIFKDKATRAKGPGDMWAIETWLSRRRREIDVKYDFRYSQIIIVFGRLLRENRITEEQLAGLEDDKLSRIEHIAAL